MAEGLELILYKLPKEKELLTDAASFQSISAFLKVCDVDFQVEERTNVTSMSDQGASPLVRARVPPQDLFLSGLEEVAALLQSLTLAQGPERGALLRGQHAALFTLVRSTFQLAESYLQWCEPENVKAFTRPQLSHGLPWPLSQLVSRSAVLSYQWNHRDIARLTLEQVTGKLEKVCTALEACLEEEQTFFPTVIHCPLEALVWGHMEALLTAAAPVNPCSAVLLLHHKLMSFHSAHSSRLNQQKGLLL